MGKDTPEWYGEAARSIAPVGLVMSFFLLVYSIWFGFAWGVIGWLLFGVSLLLAVFISMKSSQNIKHAQQFTNHQTKEGKRISKAMGILSGVTYTIIWLMIIILVVLKLYVFIMPLVTLIIGLHFIPQARIMDRKIDYFVAPLPIISSLLAIYLALETAISLLNIYAIASVGGALATTIYGLYLLANYDSLAKKHT